MVRLELSDPFVPGKWLCPYLYAFVHTVSPAWMPPFFHYFYICQNPFICTYSVIPSSHPNPSPNPPSLSSHSNVPVSLHNGFFLFCFLILHLTQNFMFLEGLSPMSFWFFPLSLSFFFLFRAAPTTYGSSQPRGRTGATAASLWHSHGNTGSELHLQPISQLMAMPDP